jgi:hypothetical protein
VVTHDEPKREFKYYQTDFLDLLLHHGDALEYLHLAIGFTTYSFNGSTPTLDSLVFDANWPRLHSLIFDGEVRLMPELKFIPEEEEPSMCLWSFFQRHTTLRCVQFGGNEHYPFYMWKEDMVPISLRSLGVWILPPPMLFKDIMTHKSLWSRV